MTSCEGYFYFQTIRHILLNRIQVAQNFLEHFRRNLSPYENDGSKIRQLRTLNHHNDRVSIH
jgi:hypothetical protein